STASGAAAGCPWADGPLVRAPWPAARRPSPDAPQPPAITSRHAPSKGRRARISRPPRATHGAPSSSRTAPVTPEPGGRRLEAELGVEPLGLGAGVQDPADSFASRGQPLHELAAHASSAVFGVDDDGADVPVTDAVRDGAREADQLVAGPRGDDPA